MTCNPPLVDPDVILAGDTYAIMHIDVREDGSKHYDYMMEAYNDLRDAEHTCAALNAVDNGRYQVVTINKDVKVIHVWDGTNDDVVLREMLDAAMDDERSERNDAALKALRYVYSMLNDDDLATFDILPRLRGYCEASGLVEFA
jgi:hypothetical protein